jgi:hypothetical protein
MDCSWCLASWLLIYLLQGQPPQVGGEYYSKERCERAAVMQRKFAIAEFGYAPSWTCRRRLPDANSVDG